MSHKKVYASDRLRERGAEGQEKEQRKKSGGQSVILCGMKIVYSWEEQKRRGEKERESQEQSVTGKGVTVSWVFIIDL